MIRRFLLTVLILGCALSSCDNLKKIATQWGPGSSGELNGESVPWTPSEATGSSLDPEVALAFNEISNSLRAHNTEFLRRHDAGLPCNGPAYTEATRVLDDAGRRHGGLTKQIIDAVNQTVVYEKSIFEVFDFMDERLAGMETQAGTAASRRRGFIQIIDSGIRTYDKGISYLETGQDPQYRYSFQKKMVPEEVVDQFLYAKKTGGEKVRDLKLEMFREGRAAFQSYRTAFSQTDQAKANTHLAEARRHEQKSNQLLSQMVSEIRKQLSAAPAL